MSSAARDIRGTRAPPGVRAVAFSQVMTSALSAAVTVCKTVSLGAEADRARGGWPRVGGWLGPHSRSSASWLAAACPSSSRRASCRRAKIIVKSVPYGRVLRMALRATLECDLPRQRTGTCKEDGERVELNVLLTVRSRERCIHSQKTSAPTAIAASKGVGPSVAASFAA